jgi:hypothetical protein
MLRPEGRAMFMCMARDNARKYLAHVANDLMLSHDHEYCSYYAFLGI